MNKENARAWDEVAVLAQVYGATLVREGHRFFYYWQGSDPAVEPGAGSLSETSEFGGGCALWVEDNMPRFGVRVGTVSARCWHLEAATAVLEALLAGPPALA